MFPARDVVVRYLEDYARQNDLEVRFGADVARIERDDGSWRVHAAGGDINAPQVIVATGYEHTPMIPDWPGRERFGGTLIHAAKYRNAKPFVGQSALVVGPGCSGMEIAHDLAEGGAERVWLAVRTPPNIVLRRAGPIPGDLIGIAMLRWPARFTDPPMRFVRRRVLGDLTEFGLPMPAEGLFSRLRREGKAPAILDAEVIDAIKERRINVVAGVESLDETGVNLADASRIEPDVIVAATGYSPGLTTMVGHLGVLDERGIPRAVAGTAALPGLRFIGYVPRPGQIGYMGGEAKRAARAIAHELGVAHAAAG